MFSPIYPYRRIDLLNYPLRCKRYAAAEPVSPFITPRTLISDTALLHSSSTRNTFFSRPHTFSLSRLTSVLLPWWPSPYRHLRHRLRTTMSSFASVVRGPAIQRVPDTAHSDDCLNTYYHPAYHAEQITQLLRSPPSPSLLLHFCDGQCPAILTTSTQAQLQQPIAQRGWRAWRTAVEVVLFSGEDVHQPHCVTKSPVANSLIVLSPKPLLPRSLLLASILIAGCVWFDRLEVAGSRVEHFPALVQLRVEHITALLKERESTSEGLFIRLHSFKAGRLLPPRPQSPTRSRRGSTDSLLSVTSVGSASSARSGSSRASDTSEDRVPRGPARPPYAIIDLVQSSHSDQLYLALLILDDATPRPEHLVLYSRQMDLSEVSREWRVYVPPETEQRLRERLGAPSDLPSPKQHTSLVSASSERTHTTTTVSEDALTREGVHVMEHADMDGVELEYWDPGQPFPGWEPGELIFRAGRVVGIDVVSTSPARRISTAELIARLTRLRDEVFSQHPQSSGEELDELLADRLCNSSARVFFEQLTPRFAERMTAPFGCEDLLLLDGVILSWAGDAARLIKWFDASDEEMLSLCSTHIQCMPLPVPRPVMLMMPAERPSYVVRHKTPSVPVTLYSKQQLSWENWDRVEFPPFPSLQCDEKPARTTYLCPVERRMRLWWCRPVRIKVNRQYWTRRQTYSEPRWNWFLVDTGAPTSLMWREHLVALQPPSSSSTLTSGCLREEIIRRDTWRDKAVSVYFGEDEQPCSGPIMMRPTHRGEPSHHALQILGLDVLQHYIAALDFNVEGVLAWEKHPDAELSLLQARAAEMMELKTQGLSERRHAVAEIDEKHATRT